MVLVSISRQTSDGKGRHLAHQVVKIEIGVVAEIFFGMVFEQPARVATPAAAPHDPVDLRMFVEPGDQRLRHARGVFLGQLRRSARWSAIFGSGQVAA